MILAIDDVITGRLDRPLNFRLSVSIVSKGYSHGCRFSADRCPISVKMHCTVSGGAGGANIPSGALDSATGRARSAAVGPDATNSLAAGVGSNMR